MPEDETEKSADPFYSAANMAYLSKVTAEIESGRARLEEHKPIDD